MPDSHMETFSFASPKEFRTWLAKHHGKSNGIWLKVYKKSSAKATATYAEALDDALCFGWIDGQKKPFDEESWLQKFTPRRPRSGWSKANTEHVERLIEKNKMRAAGMKEVEAAKADGRWAAAYDRFSQARVSDDFLQALEKNPKAKAFYKTLNKTNLFSISYRLQTAKREETKQKRIKEIVAMLARGETFH
ncbi:MAG TPA: YdeI/OmpD-associated family protein [Candidatus Kapabacteria bacterium]